MTLELLVWTTSALVVVAMLAGLALASRWATERAEDRDLVVYRIAGIAGRSMQARQRRLRPADQRRLTAAGEKLAKAIRLRGSADNSIRFRLMQAGFFEVEASTYYAVAKAVFPLAGLALGFGFIAVTGLTLASPYGVMALSAFGVVGSRIVDRFVARRIKTRREQMSRSVADLLDLLVICLEAGNSVEQSLERIAGEMEDVYPVMSTELRILLGDLRLDRARAYDNLMRRIPLPEIRSVATTLRQNDSAGGGVAEGLRTIAAEARRGRQFAAERQAAGIPVKMTLPLIALIMPSMFLILLGPGALSLVKTFGKVSGLGLIGP